MAALRGPGSRHSALQPIGPPCASASAPRARPLPGQRVLPCSACERDDSAFIAVSATARSDAPRASAAVIWSGEVTTSLVSPSIWTPSLGWSRTRSAAMTGATRTGARSLCHGSRAALPLSVASSGALSRSTTCSLYTSKKESVTPHAVLNVAASKSESHSRGTRPRSCSECRAAAASAGRLQRVQGGCRSGCRNSCSDYTGGVQRRCREGARIATHLVCAEHRVRLARAGLRVGEVFLQCTCDAHAVCMRCACSAHAGCRMWAHLAVGEDRGVVAALQHLQHRGTQRLVDVGLRISLVEDVVEREDLGLVRSATRARHLQRGLLAPAVAHDRLRAAGRPDPHRHRDGRSGGILGGGRRGSRGSMRGGVTFYSRQRRLSPGRVGPAC